MSELQVWALIVGGLALAWHAVGVWGRVTAVREILREPDEDEVEGRTMWRAGESAEVREHRERPK